jgi:Trypsin-co-occurring domain 1
VTGPAGRKEIVELALGDGAVVRAEVLALDQAARRDGTGGDAGLRRTAAQVGQGVAMRLDEVRDLVRGMARWAHETVRAQEWQPDVFEVEFGLKLAAKSGHLVGIIAEASGESSLTVRMSWETGARRRAAGAPASGGGATGGTAGGTASDPDDGGGRDDGGGTGGGDGTPRGADGGAGAGQAPGD